MISVVHVDPDSDFRSLLKQRLEALDLGIGVDPFANGIEAVTRCKRNDVDVVLVGYSPLLDAFELVKTLRGVTGVPIVVYSFADGENISNQVVDAGADAYIVLDESLSQPSQLVKRIQAMVNKGVLSRAASTMESVHEYAPRILASRTLKDLSRNTLDAIEAGFASEITSFMFLEGGELVCVERRWLPNRLRVSLGGDGPQARSVREGRSVSIREVGAAALEDIVVRSELSIPIKNGDAVAAVVDLRSSREDAFGEADVKAAENLCLYVGCTFRLISELKSLVDAKAQYRGFMDSLGEAVSVFVDMRYAYVNQRGADLLGYTSPSDLVGRDIYETVSTDYHDVVREKLSRRVDGKLDTYEVCLLRRDGSTIPVEFEASPISFEGRDAYLVVEKDVSGIREMRDRLKGYASDLEKQVEKRTQELVEAQQFAAAGKLASMVGHDLRSPLQSIRNATYLIKRQPERLDEMLNSVEVSVDRALAMLEDLRYRTRETPLKLESVDLPALIVDVLKDAPVPENIQVDLRLDPSLKVVELDSMKIRRVLDNMVRNSLEAMPGGGRLTVETRGSGDSFAVMINDTGVGIAESDFPSLFKPFYTTKVRGLGLGLAYCLKAVEAHGGTIEVVSKVGEGTTFKMLLGKRLLERALEAKER